MVMGSHSNKIITKKNENEVVLFKVERIESIYITIY